MASQLYPSSRQMFLTAQLSWLVGDYKAILLPESYNFDDEDVYLADVFSGVRIAISELIENKTAVDGIASCDPIEFPQLVDNRNVAKAIIFKDTGDEATSPLVVFLDSESLFGVPFQPVGLDYFITPSVLEGGIFRL